MQHSELNKIPVARKYSVVDGSLSWESEFLTWMFDLEQSTQNFFLVSASTCKIKVLDPRTNQTKKKRKRKVNVWKVKSQRNGACREAVVKPEVKRMSARWIGQIWESRGAEILKIPGSFELLFLLRTHAPQCLFQMLSILSTYTIQFGICHFECIGWHIYHVLCILQRASASDKQPYFVTKR